MKIAKVKRRKPMGLGPQLLAAFLLVALVAPAAGAAGLLSLRQAAEAARVLDQSASMILAVQEIRVALGAVSEPLGAWLVNGDPQAEGRFAAAMGRVRARLAAYAAAHALHRHSAAHALSAHELIGATTSDVQAIDELGQAIFAEPDQAAANYAALEAKRAEATARLEQLVANAEEDILAARADAARAERAAALELGTAAVLAFALAAGLGWYLARRLTRPLGALLRAAERIGSGDLQTPVSVAAPGELGQLAGAFEHMRRMLVHERERARRLAILEERDRIGREMHDGLAQVLGYVNTKAQAVREYLRAGEAGPAEQHVEELIGAAREAYTEAREAIADMRLAGVEAHERGLRDVLHDQLEHFRRQTGIAAELQVGPDWPDETLSPTVRVQALRIVQEALSNIRKHAHAEHVRVSLDREAQTGQAWLRVADDGCGFALSRLLSPDFSRYGLRTMRERAQALGGTFRIESQPGEGTRVIVHLPLLAPEEEAP